MWRGVGGLSQLCDMSQTCSQREGSLRTHLNAAVCPGTREPISQLFIRLPLQIRHCLIPVRAPYPSHSSLGISQIVPVYGPIIEPDQKVMRFLGVKSESRDRDGMLEVFPVHGISFAQILSLSSAIKGQLTQSLACPSAPPVRSQ